MILGIERRQVPASVADERSKSIEGVRMNTSKVNESAPMIVRVVQGSLMGGWWVFVEGNREGRKKGGGGRGGRGEGRKRQPAGTTYHKRN